MNTEPIDILAIAAERRSAASDSLLSTNAMQAGPAAQFQRECALIALSQADQDMDAARRFAEFLANAGNTIPPRLAWWSDG